MECETLLWHQSGFPHAQRWRRWTTSPSLIPSARRARWDFLGGLIGQGAVDWQQIRKLQGKDEDLGHVLICCLAAEFRAWLGEGSLQILLFSTFWLPLAHAIWVLKNA